MGVYESLIKGAERFGIPRDKLCESALAVEPEVITKNVIIAPWWMPEIFSDYVDSIEKVGGDLFEIYYLNINGEKITYIRTGVGANRILDATLALGLTPCENVVFLGSVAGLKKDIGIGDILIPKSAICGDGACRYIGETTPNHNDAFENEHFMAEETFSKLYSIANKYSDEVKIHEGRVFSIDSIFAEFAHIDYICSTGVNGLEMEISAFLRAVEVAGLNGGAVCSISDNIILEKSLYYGRSEEEYNHRVYTRKTILTKIVLDYFGEVKNV